MVGSVFSPRYARALRRGEAAAPTDHAALHLALYRRGRPIGWVMSEHAGDEQATAIGRSRIETIGGGWRITVDERAMPWRGRVAGTIEIEPSSPALPGTFLDGGERHAWTPLHPRARVRARFARPDFALDADGYCDRNSGARRLEDDFARWTWARFHHGAGATVVYTTVERDGTRRALVARSDGGGGEIARAEPIVVGARRLGWGLVLPSRIGAGALAVEPLAPLEHSPFYARFRARLTDGARTVEGLGEHVDVGRFRSRLVQFLTRYKIRNGFFR